MTKSKRISLCYLRKFLLISLLATSYLSQMSTNTIEAKVKTPKSIEHIKTYGGISEYKLKNGLTVLTKPDLNSPLISWQVWYKVGSRNENTSYTGIAHYLEHMMFKGTDQFDKGEISQSIQLRGGIFNAFTGDDYTAYFENFAPENLELAIKLEADRMRNSRLNEEELNLERSVIVSELEGGENNPMQTLYKTLKATAYNVHPYKNPIIGWPQDLNNINAKTMREFYDTYYQPNNATAILAGNFDTELALELIDAYFGDFKAGELPYPPVSEEPEQRGERKAVIEQEGLITYLAQAFHIPKFTHEDYAALNIVSDILFGGTSSRTYKSLIDSNKAIDVSGYAESGIDPGLLRIIVNIPANSSIEEVEQILNKELEAVKNGVSPEELEKAKARVEASAVYDRDGVYHQGIQIGYFHNMATWETYIDWVDIVNKITNDDIKRVTKKYLVPSNRTTVHLLPTKAKESLIASADFLENATKKQVQGYGAGTVEKLDPKKLKKLLKLTEPKLSKKKIKNHKLDLNIEKIVNNEKLEIDYKFEQDPPLVFVNGIMFAGKLANPEGKNGLAGITAEMLERGTTEHDKFELSELLDLYGAEISFKSKKEAATFEITTLSKNFDKVFELFKESITMPAFDPAELEKLKKELIGQIEQENEYPRKIIARELNRIIYPATHPYYSYSPEEKIKQISSITIDDIKKFYATYYNADHMKVSVVGDISIDKVKKEIVPTLEYWNAGKGVGKSFKFNDKGLPSIEKVKAKQPVEKSIIVEEKQQVEIAMGHAGDITRLDDDFYPMLLANYALGGSALSSRLGTVVRDENGLVYDIHSGFNASLGAGSFYISLGCNPKNVTKAIRITKKAVKDFLEEGIAETELEATKAYIGGSFAARNLQSNEETSETLSHLMLYKLGKEYIENYSEIIEKITKKEVDRVMRKYIKPDMFNVVIAGPKYE